MTEEDPQEPLDSGAEAEAKKIEAEAKKLKAEASLVKAKQPLLDKIILRGIIPIALAVVGPWAFWTFDDARVEQERQGQVIEELHSLLEGSREDAGVRQTRDLAWRERMRDLEVQKAAELAAMSSMVIRLNDTLSMALIQMAVSRAIENSPSPTRQHTVEIVLSQIQFPGAEDAELERIAGEAYDRILEQRQDQAQQEQ